MITPDYRKNPIEVHQYILRDKSLCSFYFPCLYPEMGYRQGKKYFKITTVECQLCKDHTYGDET